MKMAPLANIVLILESLIATGSAAEPPRTIELQGHTQAVTTIAWAADGMSLATAGDDRTIRTWEIAAGRLIATRSGIAREGYGGPVVAFTSDLKIAVVNYWGAISLLAVADGKVLGKIDPILDRGKDSTFRPDVFAMAFSPDGRRLATAGATSAQSLPGGIVIVWDVETGKPLHKFEPLTTAAGAVAWSADGRRLAAGTTGVGGEVPEAGEVIVWDTEDWKLSRAFHVKEKVAPGEWISAADVAIAPNGERIAVSVSAGGRAKPAGLILEDTGASIVIGELATGEVTRPVSGLAASVGRLAYSPDGKSLATAGADKVARVWNPESGRELAAFSCPDEVGAIAYSPDGKLLAAGCKDGSVRVFEAPTPD